MTLKQLAKKHHFPYSTLASWIERELIEVRRTGMSGSRVILNDKNITELENLINLRKGGLSLQRARHLMDDMRAAGYNPLSRGCFVVINKREHRVVRIMPRATREVAGPHRGQYVM